MIVSAIVDPDIFGPAGIVDSESRDKAIALLKGIITNGVWIDKSKAKSLLRVAIENAKELDQKLKQRVLIALESIFGNWKKFVAAFGKLESHLEDGTFAVQVAELMTLAKPDAVLATASNIQSIYEQGCNQQKVVSVDSLHDSAYEKLRQAMLEPEKPLNELGLGEIQELVGRALKYASSVHIFDYLMAGKRGSAKSNFLPGIANVLAAWDKHFVFGNPDERRLVLYPASERPMQNETLPCEEVDKILDDCIVSELAATTKITIERRTKKDSDKYCHTRGFLAKGRAYTIDPGIDALKTMPPKRPVLFARSKAAETVFKKYQALKGIV